MSVLIRDRSIERGAVVSPFERTGRVCALSAGLGVVTLMLSACAPMPMGEPGVEAPVSSVRPTATRTPAAPGALARHRAWQDAEPMAWPAANEAVRQAGGWRAYAREGQLEPDEPVRPAPAPAAPVAPR